MFALSLPDDAPPAHRLLAEHWGLIRDKCIRAARSMGLDADDLTHDAVTYILAQHDRLIEHGVAPEAFVQIRLRKAIASTFINRWRRLTCLPDTNGYAATCEDDPATAAELADLLSRIPDLLATLDAGERDAVIHRFGLNGQKQLVGKPLAAKVGRSQSAAEARVRRAIRRMAAVLGEDPERCGMTRGE